MYFQNILFVQVKNPVCTWPNDNAFVFHSMWLTGFYKVIRLKTEHVSNYQSGNVKFPPDRDV